MKFNNLHKLFVLLLFVYACQKEAAVSSSNLTNKWVFKKHWTRIYYYPSGTESPTSGWGWSSTSDSCTLMLTEVKKYSFKNDFWPLENGSYSIVNDTFLVFKPDGTSTSIYSFLHNLPFGSSNADSVFGNETISFKLTTEDKLAITRTSIYKANPPAVLPNKDTLMRGVAVYYFEKKQ